MMSEIDALEKAGTPGRTIRKQYISSGLLFASSFSYLKTHDCPAFAYPQRDSSSDEACVCAHERGADGDDAEERHHGREPG